MRGKSLLTLILLLLFFGTAQARFVEVPGPLTPITKGLPAKSLEQRWQEADANFNKTQTAAFASTSAMVTASNSVYLQIGNLYRTSGRWFAGDAGKAEYIIVPVNDYTGTPDELSDFTVNSGTAVAVLQRNGVINYAQFGATPDDIIDDTASINRANAVLRTLMQSPAYQTIKVFMPSGAYVANGSLDFTNIRITSGQESGFWEISAYGAVVTSHATGKVAVDFMKSSGVKLSGLTVIGHGTDTPKIGIQVARGDSGTASINKLEDVKTDGKFSLAALYNMGSERFSADHCLFNNRDTSLSSYVYIADGRNMFDAQSDY